MNWKILSIAFLGLSLTACDEKKEEKKTVETKPLASGGVEEKTTIVKKPVNEANKEEAVDSLQKAERKAAEGKSLDAGNVRIETPSADTLKNNTPKDDKREAQEKDAPKS